MPGRAGYPEIYLYRRLLQAKLFIDRHYAEPIDLDNIADEAYFSRFHFIRLFSRIYGHTPHRYLRKVRVKEAMKLLGNGVPVNEACEAVGFESLSSFSGLFSRVNGVSPSVYRQRQVALRQRMVQSPMQFIPGCHAKKQF